MKKNLLIFLLIIVIVGGIFFYVRFYVPYSSSSVRAGELNYVMYKGVIFKTWEGKLIQSGFRSKTAGAVQSNEFEFSIENEELAQKLMSLTGSNVKLHYKEYYAILPWRGYTKYIVDSIVAVDQTLPATTNFLFQEN
jgi:hypothetical protein